MTGRSSVVVSTGHRTSGEDHESIQVRLDLRSRSLRLRSQGVPRVEDLESEFLDGQGHYTLGAGRDGGTGHQRIPGSQEQRGVGTRTGVSEPDTTVAPGPSWGATEVGSFGPNRRFVEAGPLPSVRPCVGAK